MLNEPFWPGRRLDHPRHHRAAGHDLDVGADQNTQRLGADGQWCGHGLKKCASPVDHLRTMDPGLYIAASGMLAEQVRQNQLSNDLANASTPGYKPDHGRAAELRLAAAGQHVHRAADRHDQHRRADRQDRHRHLPVDAQPDRPAAGLRHLRHRLLRRAHELGHPLHARRPVLVEQPEPARRPAGQPGARPERPADHREQQGHRPRLRPRRLQRAQRHQAGRPTTSPGPPRARPAAPSSRASSRPPASTPFRP